jgi:hypothetical protein
MHSGVVEGIIPPNGKLLELIEQVEGPVLIDFTGSAEVVNPSTSEADCFDDFLETGAYILCSLESVLRSPQLLEKVSGGRVFISFPLLYHPVILEIRRIIHERQFGDVGGIEMVMSKTLSNAEIAFFLCGLAGIPSGFKAAPPVYGLGTAIDDHSRSAGSNLFFWFREFGCIAREGALPGGTLLSLDIACREATIRAQVPIGESVEIFPAGKEPYVLPLPEGDGVYYQQIEVRDSVLARDSLSAFSTSMIEAACRWAQEYISEGT